MEKTPLIKIMPDEEKIGEYTLFAKNITKKDKSLIYDLVKKENKKITNIITNTAINLEFLKNDLGINQTNITTNNLEKIMGKIKTPSWINKEQNFQKILNQDYQNIKPITAEFITTLNCNYRCVQCAYDEPKKSLDLWLDGEKFQVDKTPNKHMTKEDMDLILNNLAKGGRKKHIIYRRGRTFNEPSYNRRNETS